MEKLIIRSDDFDFRMETEYYVAVHEHFIANDLIETAVVQIAKLTNGHATLVDFEAKKDLIEYMNTAPNWDIQIHCLAHNSYHEMNYDDIVRDMSAALFHFQRLFNKLPTVWYTPRNGRSDDMEQAARVLNLTISNEDMPIRRFVDKRDIDWENGKFKGHSLYFHSWKHQEMEYFEKMIKLAKEVTYGTSEI